jgi:hypothetical protein
MEKIQLAILDSINLDFISTKEKENQHGRGKLK